MKNALRTLVALWSLVWCLTVFAADTNLDLAQYRGKVVYLDFWASWCVPCRHSFPWMNAMQEKYGGNGLVIIGVDLDEQRSDADIFLQQVPAQFKLVFDPQGHLAEQYNLVAMPMSFLIGRDGEVVQIHNGFFDDSPAKYESEIQTLMAK